MVNEKLIINQQEMYKTEEVRVLENQETLTNKFLKSIFPNAYCMDDKDKETLVKVGIGAVSAVTGAFCPPAGVAVAVGGGLTGKAMESIGDDSNDEELKKAGKIISTGTEIGGSVGSGAGKGVEKVAENVVKGAFGI